MRGLGLLIALAALAAAGRLAFLAVPNVALTFFVVAVAGLAYGPRMGAGVGALAMLVTSAALTGPTPAALPGAAAAALLGAFAGMLGRLGYTARRRVPAALLGASVQLAFSVVADAGIWAMFGGPGVALAPFVLAGLAFNAPAAVVQAALFGAALGPVLRALRAAGLAEEPRRRRVREVVIATYTTATVNR